MLVRRLINTLCLLMTLTSCIYGSRQLEDGRLAYNEAVRASNEKALLLNIVRLRYMDTVEFLSTDSISSQLNFEIGIGIEAGQDRGDGTKLGMGDVRWSNRPTFTFTPRRGSEFAKTLLSPFSMDLLHELLNKQGRRSDLLLRLLIHNINGLVNVPGNISPDFLELINLLALVQTQTLVEFGTAYTAQAVSAPIPTNQVTGKDLLQAAREGYRFQQVAGSSDQLVLTKPVSVPTLYLDQSIEQRSRILELLGLPPDHPETIEIRTHRLAPRLAGSFKGVLVETASIMEAMSYLAGGIKVPQSHTERGLTTQEWPPNYQGRTQIDDFFQVGVADARPTANLAVQYRDVWYYIDDSDLESRQTFQILRSILNYAVQSAPSGAAPVLTLPVGGG